MMRNITISLLFLFFIIANVNATISGNIVLHTPLYPNDSVLNRITNINLRLKEYTTKDTLGGFSSPRKIETSSYFNPTIAENAPLRDREGLIVVPLNYQPFLSYVNFIDTIIISPVMLPIVFEGKLIPKNMDFRSIDITKDISTNFILISRDSIAASDFFQYQLKEKPSYKLINKDSTLSNKLWLANKTSLIRKQYYTNYPTRVKLNALAFNSSTIVEQEVEIRNPFKELIRTGDVIEITKPDITKFEVKQRYWKKWGEHKLEVSQKAYSEKWNPQTNDNFQIQNYHKFSAQYRKNKIEFNHLIEWRLNSQYISLPTDEKLKEGEEDMRATFLINDDWLRTYNKLGLDAFIKRWSYIITLELKTPVFNKYAQNNKRKRLSGLFSPLEGNFGIGAGYTYERKSKTTKGREFKLSIDTNPLSVDIKHVGSDKVYYYYEPNGERKTNNTHGVEYEKGDKKEGLRRYTKTELGFTLNTTLDYKLNSYTSVFSRAKLFANYKDRTYFEFENTIRFQLNRFLATSLYVFTKYDDAVSDDKKDVKWGYFSFNEVLGFGLSYNW